MIFALLAILIVGLALYETGYGVTNTWLKSFRKQIIVQVSAASAFLISTYTFLPDIFNNFGTLTVLFGFLSMLAYTATATIKECHLTAVASALVGGVLFPIILHFTESYFTTIHFIDNAGAGLVHFVGGTIALIAGLYTTKIMRADQGIVIRPYSATVGFLILWAGWIAYVGIISLPVLQASFELWIKGLINLSTATAWGALSAVVYMLHQCGRVKMRTCTVGGLAGMVAMSADPFSSPFWAAMVIGGIGGIAAVVTYGILCKYKVGDRSNTISIHFLPGLLGVLTVPLFNEGAFLTAQITGLALLLVLASSMGVVVCEVHNLAKKNPTRLPLE